MWCIPPGQNAAFVAAMEDVLELWYKAAHLHPAVSEGCEQLLLRVQLLAADQLLHHLPEQLFGDGDALAAQLLFKHGAALDDVLLPALLFEPGPYLALGLAGLDDV